MTLVFLEYELLEKIDINQNMYITEMNNIKTINNKGVFDGGYFILNNLGILIHGKEEDFLVTLSYENSIKDEIIKVIRESKTSIKICSFIITDKDILTEIESVLNNHKVVFLY